MTVHNASTFGAFDSLWSPGAEGAGLWQPAPCDQAPSQARIAAKRRSGICDDYEVQLLHGADALTDLEEDWRLLDEAAETPAEQFIWVSAAARAFEGQASLEVITVSNGEGLLAAAPLTIRGGPVLRRASLLGARELWEPIDVAAVNQEARLILLRHMIRLNRPLDFDRLPASSLTLTLGAAAARNRAWWTRQPQGDCSYIPLDATWLDPISHLDSERGADLRAARRAAESFGPLTTEILSPRQPELAALLNMALGVESGNRSGERDGRLQNDGGHAGFYRRYAAQAARVGILRLCFLRAGDRVLASLIAVETCSKFWLLTIRYDQRLRRSLPAMLLLGDTIAYAAQRGLTAYEFLGRDPSWMKLWTPRVRPLVAMRIYPWLTCGAGALASDMVATLMPLGSGPETKRQICGAWESAAGATD